MKGIVFTEFLDMVDAQFSPAVTERIVQSAHLPSGGAYTAVGTYDHGEMWSLVSELSKAVEIPMPELLKSFGEHLLARLAVGHAGFFQGHRSSFDFLETLGGVIHREVRKLYADAELPSFQVAERTPVRMVLIYQSPRHFADLAEGLLRGCGRHFGEQLDIAREPLPCRSGSRVRFTLKKQ